MPVRHRYFHAGTGHRDARGIELAQHGARDLVLDVADAVRGNDEADGHLEPVVREVPERLWIERLELETILLDECITGRDRAFLVLADGAADRIEQDSFRSRPVGAVWNADV